MNNNKKGKVVPFQTTRQQKRNPQPVQGDASTMPDVQKLLNDEIMKLMIAVEFDTTPEGRAQIAATQKMQRKLSINALSGEFDNYRRLVKLDHTGSINLLDASFFLNAASTLSPEDMNCTEDEYADFMQKNDDVVAVWNIQATVIKTEAMKNVQDALSKTIVAPATKKIISPN